MRKSGLIKKALVFLILSFQTPVISGQEFGRIPLEECWRIENENISGIEIASDNVSGVYLSDSDGFIEAIDKYTGGIIWKTEIGGEIIPKVIIDSQRLFIVSKSLSLGDASAQKSDGMTIRSLSLSTGITNWQKSFSLSNDEELFLLDNAEKLFIITRSGSLTAVSKQNGEVLFEKHHKTRITGLPFLYGESIYFGTDDRKIKTVSISDGRLAETVKIPGIPKSLFINGNANLFVGDAVGNVLSLDIRNLSVKWKTWTGAEVTNITKVDKGILVLSLDNYVYLLSEKNGKRIWKKRLSGRSIGNPLIKDNVAVFSTYGGTDAVFIELKKGKPINQLSVRDENYFTNNPKGLGDFIFFPTHKGIFAYSAANGCKNKK